MRPFSDIDRLAEAEVLDRVAAPARDLVQKLLVRQDVKDALHGVWLGHPLHPSLVHLSLGSFVSAGVLDLVPRTRRPAAALIGLGLLTAAPAAASGWADYADGHEEQQRVGIVHAAANITMITGYVASLAARLRGRSTRGALWGWAALAVGSAGAALGGHMSYTQAMGANKTEPVPHVGPAEWTGVGALADLAEGEPTRRLVGETPVLLVRHGDDVAALADRCSHASAPLSDGSLQRVDGEGECVVCPWHASVFRLADGAVVHGPATAPQPRFHTRVLAGRLEVRVVEHAGVPAGG